MCMWLIYALLNPFFFTISGYIEKFLIDKKIKNPVALTILGGIIYFFTGIVILFLFHFPVIPTGEIIALIIAGILLQLYLVTFYKALALDEASRVIPLFNLVPLITLVFSVIFLGERLTNQQLVAFLILLSGAFMISIEKFDMRILKPRKSLWYMILTSLMYAAVVLLFKFVVIYQNFWVTTGYKALGGGIGALLLFTIPSYRKGFLYELKKANHLVWTSLLSNQATIMLGELAGSFAISLAPVSLVTAVEGTQPVFVLIGGILLSLLVPHIIKEDITKKTLVIKTIAIVLITLGVCLISF